MLARFPGLSAIHEYFGRAEVVASSALAAVGAELGDSGLLAAGPLANYRMVDYPAGSGTCLAHRDFGLLTLVQQDGVAGLEVELAGSFVPVPAGCSVLLAGWCLHLRSNGRVPAPLHRVARPAARRTSAVVFLAPAKVRCRPHPQDWLVEPLPGAAPLYRAIAAGQLKADMAKRWRKREGTLAPGSPEDSQEEFDPRTLRIQKEQ